MIAKRWASVGPGTCYIIEPRTCGTQRFTVPETHRLGIICVQQSHTVQPLFSFFLTPQNVSTDSSHCLSGMKLALCEVGAHGSHGAVRRWVNKTWIGTTWKGWLKTNHFPLQSCSISWDSRRVPPSYTEAKNLQICPEECVLHKAGACCAFEPCSQYPAQTLSPSCHEGSLLPKEKPWSPVQIGRTWF